MGEIIEFANNHPFLTLAVFASLIAVLVNEARLKGQGVTHVSTADAVRLINKGAHVVDVRPAEQYQAGHIINARNVPLAELEADSGAVKKPKNKTVLTVCDNGSSAGRAANTLRKAGFETVFSLKGGLSSWKAENLPLVK
jgi:rhodanese-related sulfurtransferase